MFGKARDYPGKASMGNPAAGKPSSGRPGPEWAFTRTQTGDPILARQGIRVNVTQRQFADHHLGSAWFQPIGNIVEGQNEL